MLNQLLFLIRRGKQDRSHSLGARIRSVALILIFVISLIGISHGVASAAGNTYYVDNTVTCSNSGAGSGTLAKPLCTIAEGAFRANAGDTVYVLDGTYAETVLVQKSGTDGQPITFKADPGVTVTGNAAGFGSAFAISTKSYIVIDGFDITQTKYMGIYVTASNHITITNNHVSYAGDHSLYPDVHSRGIYISGTTDSVITNNTTDHNTCVGIMLLNGSDRNLVSNNLSFGNASEIVADAAGITLTGSSYNTVVNNIAYGNEDSGISVYENAGFPAIYNLLAGNLVYGNGDHGIDHNDAPYNTVVGNTIHGNGTVGINFEGNLTGSHHAVVANNIVVANGITPNPGAFGGNLRVDAMSTDGTTLDYNIYDRQGASVQIIWNSAYYNTLAAFKSAQPTQEAHGIQGNPLFVAPVSPVLRDDSRPYYITPTVGDYHLSAGSPAIDSANADAPGQLTTDLEGFARLDDPGTANTGAGARSFDDRGVLEYQPTGTGATTTSISCGGTPTVAYGSSLNCTVTVTAGSGTTSPGGKVHWTTDGSGTFGTSPCVLSGSGGTASCSVSYTPTEVGSGSHLIAAHYAGDASFGPSSDEQAVTVNTRGLVPAITVSDKPYDRTTAATILTRTLTGRLPGDVVSLADGAASFDNKSVGTGKTVTASGFTLTGTNAANYHLTTTTAATTASITARDLTVSAVGTNRVYNGTTTATVTLTSNAMAGDVLSLSYMAAAFDNKNAGSGKTVTVAGISLSGADAANYRLVSTGATTTASITKAPLTVTADNKVKNAGQADPVFTVTYSGFLGGDTSSAISTPPTCGVSVPHTVAGTYPITCSGGSATNYSFTFVNGTLTVNKVFVQTFQDVPVDHWAAHHIQAIYDAGITTGCSVSPLQYCPSTTVTRAQMAIFLLKAKHGSSFVPPAATGVFNDVKPTYWAAAWIEQLAKEGITSGCGNGNYCPDSPVTRDQMAVFLLKAAHGSSYAPPTAKGVFLDVKTTHWAAAWIEQLAAEGVTAGCGNGNYCPTVPVSRDQMAVFLAKMFKLPIP